MTRLKFGPKFFVLISIAALAGASYAQDAIHAVTGAVTKVDKTAKTLAVKTTDGAEEVFKYTEKTAVRDSHEGAHGTKMGVVDSYFAGKEGAYVVVRYTGRGADKTATLVEDFGKDALKTGKGTITKVDRAAHTIAVKTDDGAEATYKLGNEAVVETEHGVVRGSRFAVKDGDKIVVHYTENGAEKVVHFFKKL